MGIAVVGTGALNTVYLKTTGTEGGGTLSTSYIVLESFNIGEASCSDDPYLAFHVYAKGFA